MKTSILACAVLLLTTSGVGFFPIQFFGSRRENFLFG